LIRLLMSAVATAALSLALPAAAQTAPAAKPAKTASKAPVKKVPKVPAEPPIPPADDEQKAAASQAYLGDYACELDQNVSVAANAKHEGYLDVRHKAQSWVMKPVLSSTGALRLEDVTGRMLMIQIANKSMLMDSRIGQRLVDGCQSEKQREFARTMEPQAGLLGK
jgi:hypothetical protein